MMLYDKLSDGSIRATQTDDGMQMLVSILRPANETTGRVADDGYYAALDAYEAQETNGYATFPFAGPPEGQAAPWTFDWPASLPAGAELRIRIETGEVVTVTDMASPVTLKDAGSYALLLVPPAPDRGFYAEVRLA